MMPAVRAMLAPTAPPIARSPEATDPPIRDALSSGQSLLSLYQRNQGSLDPAERSLAWHAWSVCVTAANARAGQSTEHSAPSYGASDDFHREIRNAAHQAIAARCHSFSGLEASQLSQDATRIAERHRAGDLRSRGELAIEAVQAGNTQDAMRLIQAITQRQSAYEFRDLSGIISRWHRSMPQATDGLRDAVLAVIGCDFGMDCSADSMVSLELCAYGGECEGDLVERTLHNFPDIDRQQLNQLRVATTLAIRDGTFDAIAFFGPSVE
jgi:hypothetical protein